MAWESIRANVVPMAGYAHGGREFNVYKDVASVRAVFSNWPTRIVV